MIWPIQNIDEIGAQTTYQFTQLDYHLNNDTTHNSTDKLKLKTFTKSAFQDILSDFR